MPARFAVVLWLSLGLAWCAAVPLKCSAQDTAPPTPPGAADQPPAVAEVVTRDTIEQLKKQAESNAELSAEQKQEINSQAQAALEALARADDFSAAFQTFPAKTAAIETDRQQAAEALQNAQREAPRRPDLSNEVVQLEQELNSRQQELLQARTTLDQLDGAIVKRTERQKEIKDRLAAIPELVSQIEQELPKLDGAMDPPLLLDIRRMKLRAERRRLEQESPALQAEAAYLLAQESATLLQLRRQIENVRVKRLTEEVEHWRLDVLRKKASEAQGRIALARAQAEAAQAAPLTRIYTENALVAEEESRVREKIRGVEHVLADVTEEFQRQEASLKDFAAREIRLGSSRTFGIRLRESLHSLPDPRQLRLANSEQLTEFEEALTQSYNWQSQLSALDQLGKEVEQLSASIPPPVPAGDDDASRSEQVRWKNRVEEQVRDALTQKQDFLTRVTQAYTEYIQVMDALDAKREDLIRKIREFDAYISERVLWIPTHGWMSQATVMEDESGFRSLIDPVAWKQVLDVLADDFFDRPWLHVMALGLWIGMLFTQSRQREVLRAYGQKAGSRLNTSMQPTWSTLFWTVLKSLVFPFPFLFLGVIGRTALDPQVRDLGQSTVIIAIWLWWLELVRHVCRPLGLGVSHFQWPPRACQAVTMQLSSLLVLASPVLFLIGVLKSRAIEGHSDGLQRVCGIIFLALFGFTLHRLTSQRTGVLREWNESNPTSWLSRLNGLWHLLAISVPLVLAGLVVAGYTYAAEQLSIKLAQTLMLVFGLVMARALLLRSLSLRQRRLAIEHAREIRAAAAAVSSESGPTTVPKLDPQTARETLTEVSLQSRRLLHTTLFLSLLTGLWMIWSTVLPALQHLDKWDIWGSAFTARSLLSAGILVVLFTTAARNVPGLIEILLLEKLPLDRSVRYAVGALTRYAIAVIGILTISDALAVGWQHVQWLVAALTFGLGFGLQEIFANFVSGLIILFEQPVRVGDIVTLDGVSGTVSRIRMRSTTITDWDRKDYIVPNREFITGKLLNWTLTDCTNRIVINVGVSYDADPEEVTRILMGVVTSQPHVMTEPAPSVAFEGFGDSALSFVVRAYLPSLDDRGNTVHNLHVRIHAALKEAGIEIPFPQRDLHVRTMPPVSPLLSAVNGAHKNGSNGKQKQPEELEEALD